MKKRVETIQLLKFLLSSKILNHYPQSVVILQFRIYSKWYRICYLIWMKLSKSDWKSIWKSLIPCCSTYTDTRLNFALISLKITTGITVSMLINHLIIEDLLISFIIQQRDALSIMSKRVLAVFQRANSHILNLRPCIILISTKQISARTMIRRGRHVKRESYALLFTHRWRWDVFLHAIGCSCLRDWVKQTSTLSSGNLTFNCLLCQKWQKKKWNSLIN
jgi:hypothetical protein